MKILCVMFVMLLNISNAQGAIIVTDLVSQGDGLITTDTSTGLEWLDVNATEGQSVDSVLAGFGSYTSIYGFRHATREEMETLWSDFGLIVQYSASDAVQRDLAAHFIATVGETHANNIHSLTYGFYDLQLDGEWRVSQVHAGINSSEVYTNYSVTAQPSSASFDSIGHYLVREATATVPIPSTVLIILAGLGLLRTHQVRA